MNFASMIPTFKVLEDNRLTGLRNGHMLAQSPVDTDATTTVTKNSTYEFIENGIIVGLSQDGTISNFDREAHSIPFVHYTEPQNTLVDEDQYFAVDVEAEGDTFIRAIALYVGDTFTTDNFAGTTGAFGYINDGVVTRQATATADTCFAIVDSTLANEKAAVECTYLGFVVASEE